MGEYLSKLIEQFKSATGVNHVDINSEEFICRKQIFILGKRLRCYYHAGFAIAIPKEWDRAVFGIHIAEADADILMNEIVFNEVRLIYFKGETEEHDEFEIDRDDEKDM